MRGLSAGRYGLICLLAIGLAAGAFVLCLWVGPTLQAGSIAEVGYPEWEIFKLRLLRVGAAAIVGFGLAASGVALQALLRNALADPYVLGISGGASVGVMVFMLGVQVVVGKSGVELGLGPIPFAVAGAGATCVLVYVLARGSGGGGQMDPLTLLLVGVVVNAVAGAVLMFLNSLAPAGVRSDLVAYTMGKINEQASYETVRYALYATIAGWLPLMFVARGLNVSTLSDVEVASLGVNLSVMRTVAFFCAAVMTAASIALAGPIGFVGLICPHVCRRIFGPDHRQLMVTAPFCGALFLMLADTVCRCTGKYFNGDLPVGVITAMVGGPFFLMLLTRRARRGAGVSGGVADGA